MINTTPHSIYITGPSVLFVTLINKAIESISIQLNRDLDRPFIADVVKFFIVFTFLRSMLQWVYS